MIKKHVATYGWFLLGLFLVSLGVVLMVKAELGVSPWDVLHIGLQKTLGLTIGIWNQIVGITLVAVTVWMTRKIPGIGTLFNMILIGLFIDLIMYFHLVPDPSQLWIRWGYLLIGIVFMAMGAGIYISAHLGAGPRDGLMLALSEKGSWSVQRVKTIMELLALLFGWMLGGPIGWGTLVFSVFIGPMMQFHISFWRKFYCRSILKVEMDTPKAPLEQ